MAHLIDKEIVDIDSYVCCIILLEVCLALFLLFVNVYRFNRCLVLPMVTTSRQHNELADVNAKLMAALNVYHQAIRDEQVQRQVCIALCLWHVVM